MCGVLGVKVLHTSLSAGVLIMIIIAIRALANDKLPKKTFLILWDIVICRLLVPFSISLRLSAYGDSTNVPVTLPKENIIPIVPNTSIQYHAAVTVPVDVIKASSRSPVVYPLLSNGLVFVLIWCTVAIMMACFFLLTHLRYLREYRTALPINVYVFQQYLSKYPIRRTVQIKRLDTILDPLTYGIWRPVILLPKAMSTMDERRMKYVLAHELVHIKRFDTLRKWLLAGALCIHWFNPLVWAMYVLANRDIELACDEAVVQAFGQSARSSYALALMDMEQAKSGLTPLSNNFNNKAIEERVISIMKSKEVTTFSRALVLMLVAVMVAMFGLSLVEAKVEPKALGLFKKAFGQDVYRYAQNINEVKGEGAAVIADGCAVRLQSTLFTDHNVYAIVAVEGELPEDFSISGRIVDSMDARSIPRWKYMLFGSMEEIDHEDGVLYFLCSATITNWMHINPRDIDEEFTNAHTGFEYMKYASLKDCEGEILELTLNLDGNKYILTTVVTDVFTENLVFRPKPVLYDGYCLEEIVLTPFELKVKGFIREMDDHPESAGIGNNGWTGPYVHAMIVLADGEKINLDYDDKGWFFCNGQPVGVFRSYEADTAEFHYNWRFNGWKVDLSQVAAVTVNGVTYRVEGRKDL